MRRLSKIQSVNFSQHFLRRTNYKFLNYINKLLKDYLPYEDFDFDDDDYTIPGRVEISIDGKTAYIDAQSDVLIALYKIIKIRTDQLEGKYEEELEDEIDLRMYEDD